VCLVDRLKPADAFRLVARKWRVDCKTVRREFRRLGGAALLADLQREQAAQDGRPLPRLVQPGKRDKSHR